MADNVTIKDASGTSVVVGSDQVVDGTLGTIEVQYVKIMDGTLDGTGKAAVSANGLATDLRASASTSTTGSITTSATSVPLDVTIHGHAIIQIAGTYAGVNAAFEASVDGGTTYFSIQGSRTDGTAVETTTGVLTNTTRAWEFNVASYTHVRIRSTAFTSGTGAVTIRASVLPAEPVVGANIVNTSLAVTESGTWTVQPGNTQNTTPWLFLDNSSIVDNAGFTDGTSRVGLSGYILDEVAGTALTENDAGAARMDSKRAQIQVLEDATTRGQRAAISAAGRLSVDASGVPVPITDNAGSLTVDAPVGTPVFVRLSDGTSAIATLAVNQVGPTTGTTTSVAGSATTVTLLASNTSRKSATFYNDSTATLYLKLGATASTTSYTVQLTPNSYYELSVGYTGIIDGIWSSATGNVRITELT